MQEVAINTANERDLVETQCPEIGFFIEIGLTGQLIPSKLLQMKNVPHRLTRLNIWSPVGGTVWGGGAALLEDV